MLVNGFGQKKEREQVEDMKETVRQEKKSKLSPDVDTLCSV